MTARSSHDGDLAALAPFFEAARDDASAPGLPAGLLARILADAAEQAARRAANDPAIVVPPGRPARLPAWRAAWRATWRPAAAFAASALLGFWLGIAGGADPLLSSLALTGTSEGAVGVFFDLAEAEG